MDGTRTGDDRHPVARACADFGAWLAELGEVTMWSAPDAAVTDVIAAAETVIRQAQAVQATAVAEGQRRDLAKHVGATGPTAWLSGLLTVKPQHAKQVCRLAEHLDCGVEPTRRALAAGLIDADQAEVIASAVRGLPDAVGDELRAKAEAYLLEQADLHHAGILAGLAAHLLDVVAPEIAEQKLAEQLERAEARDARRRNRLTAGMNPWGRVGVRGEFDPESWATVAAALDPLTKPAPAQDADGVATTDARTFAQRCADALVELCRRALDTGDLPTNGGSRPQVVVTIDHERLKEAVGVGLLDTGTPLSATAIRRIACDCDLIATTLDADGCPLDVGRRKRLFDAGLRRALVLRDDGCAFPGCTRPPTWCQAHHIVHWIDGGSTSLANGVLLCGHHHRVIHRKEWAVRIDVHGRPEFIPPVYIDKDQRPRINTAHLRT